MNPRVVTGLGAVTPLGVGRSTFFEAMRAGTVPQAPAGAREVPGFDPTRYLGDKGLRTLDRLTKLLIVAARLAMHDAGFKKDGVYVQSSADRVGICCSNAYGSLEAITELDRVAKLEDARYINPAKFPNTVANSASGYASIWEDLRALNVAVSDGNCGALDAVACADIYLDTGRADALLVGGAEALSEALFLAFHRLGVPGLTGARAASGNGGDGARLGEGAALLSMEPPDLARERGAEILAEIIGYGTAFVPPEHEASLIHASPDAMQRALSAAIADAGIPPADVDLVASGVSGLKWFDDAEIAGIERVFGDRIAVAAPKALLGETLGAGGGLAMAAAIAWLGGAPPAPLVRGEVPGRLRTLAVTSLGFYGNASAVVLRAPTPESAA